MTAPSIIRIEDLCFRWPGQAEPCLEIARFDVDAGERVFIHGPSGSGKSTLLGLLGGVLTPERGVLRVLGTDLTRIAASKRDRFRADHIGFLFQMFNLVPYLSVIDNVLLPCRFSTRRRDRAVAAGGNLRGEAERLGYRLGDRIVLNHGAGDVSLTQHSDKPFTVVGILARTGTPVDRTVHIGLAAIEAIHLDWQGGAPIPGMAIPAEYVTKFDLKPKAITAALIGLKSRAGVFRVQRSINEYADEPLSAVLPGVALDQLWQVVGVAERALLAVSTMVVIVGLSGLVAVILAGLDERRRELAILRSVGARPAAVFALLSMEGLAVTLLGALLGVALLAALSAILGPLAAARFGLAVEVRIITLEELRLLGAVVGVGLLACLIPGYRAYKLSLADGLTPRI